MPTQKGATNPDEKRFRIIDTHMHVFNTDLQGKDGIPEYMPPATIEYTLQLMDEGGIDRGFLIGYNAEDLVTEIRDRGDRPHLLDADPVILKQVINRQYQFESWRANQDRFWWFPDYINPIRENFLKDLEREFYRGASGIKLLPLFHGLLPDHPVWQPVYELCRRHRKPIVLDLSWWLFGRYVGYGYNESRQRQESARSFRHFGDYARQIEPVFQKYSDIPISLAHCGTARTEEDYIHIFELINRHSNLSCDLGAIGVYGFPDAAFMKRLVNAVSARRIMYATDSPYWWRGVDSYRIGSRRWTIITDDCTFLSERDKESILARNAERFLQFRLP